MNIEELAIPDLKLITLKKFEDSRGFFVERYHKSKFADLGIHADFVQDNYSQSQPRVLRGLHYQFDQPQGKLVTCLHGEILDVAVDIRAHSPTYGQHVSVVLSAENQQWFWMPAGFAHGFVVLGEQPAHVMYKVDNLYNGAGEGAIAWNDPDFAIDWKVTDPILSDKDAIASSFQNYKADPKF